MPKISYTPKVFTKEHLEMITRSNNVINDYNAQGYQLTLRQLYYQHVARGWIANKDTEYKRLGGIISDARLAGLVDWDAIEDRTRNLLSNSHWTDPGSIIDSAASSYAIDKWAGQDYRVEVWVEKEALAGIVGQVARRLDVPYLACRGYMSQSEMWAASIRLRRFAERGQPTVIIHLGDHDPSGIDMSRDIADRMATFRCRTEVSRIALNIDQVEQYNPPPNPAKLTDSRVDGYIAAFGDSSWELDALEPSVLDNLIETEVLKYRNEEVWASALDQQEKQRELLAAASQDWAKVSRAIGWMQDRENWDHIEAFADNNGYDPDPRSADQYGQG